MSGINKIKDQINRLVSKITSGSDDEEYDETGTIDENKGKNDQTEEITDPEGKEAKEHTEEYEEEESEDKDKKKMIIRILLLLMIGYVALDFFILSEPSDEDVALNTEEKIKKIKSKKTTIKKQNPAPESTLAPEQKPTPAPEPKPTPAPELEPTPSPEQDPTLEPESEPEPEPEPEPQPEPEPTPVPEQKATPEDASTDTPSTEASQADVETSPADPLSETKSSIQPKKLQGEQEAKREEAINQLEHTVDQKGTEAPHSTQQEEQDTKLEYVAPPTYTRAGRGLVYNCKKRHWACVDKFSYFKCRENFKWNSKNNKAIECAIKAVYSSIQDCRVVNLHYINTNESTDFCNKSKSTTTQ